jgi:hypothetical protein
MSVNERRNAKRQLRRKASRLFENLMHEWLRLAEIRSVPSADNPYGGLDAKGVARAAQQCRKAVAPMLDEVSGFLRRAAARGMADAVARHGKARRPGPRRRWVSGAFSCGPMERIDDLVADGMGPKKAAFVVASELMASHQITGDELFQSWLRRKT